MVELDQSTEPNFAGTLQGMYDGDMSAEYATDYPLSGAEGEEEQDRLMATTDDEGSTRGRAFDVMNARRERHFNES